MTTLLTIDWDFFIQNRGEAAPEGMTTFPNGQHQRNWIMFDWGAFEGHGPELGGILWWSRAGTWLRGGLDIREDLAILPEKGCVDPSQFSLIMRERFPDLPEVEKFVGDSHAWAISVANHLYETYGQIDVVSFDAHCDLGYSEEKVQREADRGVADCGSWLYHGLENQTIRKVEIVYPDWKGMVEWDKCRDEPFLKPIMNRITACTWSKWLQKRVCYDNLEAVHLCRSSNWTPPWLDQGFLDLTNWLGNGVDNHEWVNLDNRDDNPFNDKQIGGYNALEVRDFNWADVEADAKMFGQMAGTVAQGDEA